MATQTEPLPLKTLCAKHKLPLRLTRRRLRRLSKAKKLSHKLTTRWEFTSSEFAALVKRLDEEQSTPPKAKPAKAKAAAAKSPPGTKRKAQPKKPKAAEPSSPEPSTPPAANEPVAHPAAN
jgi:uncharacterized protein YdaU (DUF1376 family)